MGLGILVAKTSTDYDKSADFSRYKTYSWLQVQASNDLWKQRITHAIDTQLSAKGWNKVPSGGDTSVSAFGSRQNQQTLQTFYDGMGGGWGWRGMGGMGMGTSTTTVENTPVGTLVVDIFDTQSKKLIWRGQASDTLSDKPEKNDQKVDKAAEELFKKFPPPSKG